MRTIAALALALAACTDEGSRPEPVEPIQVNLTTTDVRVVSVPIALDCGNGKTACSSELQFFSNEVPAQGAAITLVVVEHPASCNLFTFQDPSVGIGGCRTQQLMCGFRANPGEVLNLAVSCGTFP